MNIFTRNIDGLFFALTMLVYSMSEFIVDSAVLLFGRWF